MNTLVNTLMEVKANELLNTRRSGLRDTGGNANWHTSKSRGQKTWRYTGRCKGRGTSQHAFLHGSSGDDQVTWWNTERCRDQGTCQNTLGDVEAEALLDTPADMPENVESETLGERLGDEKTRAVVDTGWKATVGRDSLRHTGRCGIQVLFDTLANRLKEVDSKTTRGKSPDPLGTVRRASWHDGGKNWECRVTSRHSGWQSSRDGYCYSWQHTERCRHLVVDCHAGQHGKQIGGGQKYVETLGDLESEALDYTVVGWVEE